MAEDTKKTKEELALQLEFAEAVKAWNPFILWLGEQTDPDKVWACLEYEISMACRPNFINRLRTRFNKIRAYNELKELEERIGKIIDINHV